MRRAAVIAGVALLAGCGGSDAEPPEPTRAGTVATVGECLAAAGARAATDLGFADGAEAGQVGIALDGRTTYEFVADDGTRVYRTRRSDATPPRDAAAAPTADEEIAVLPRDASREQRERAAGCADGAPE